jgi:hypothetical protein
MDMRSNSFVLIIGFSLIVIIYVIIGCGLVG